MGACAGLCFLQTPWSPAVTLPCRARLANPRAWPKLKINGYFTELTYCWGGDGEEDTLLKSTLPIRCAGVHEGFKCGIQSDFCHQLSRAEPSLPLLQWCCSVPCPARRGSGRLGEGHSLQQPPVWHKQNESVPGLQKSIIIVQMEELSPILPSNIC